MSNMVIAATLVSLAAVSFFAFFSYSFFGYGFFYFIHSNRMVMNPIVPDSR